ncbi:TPA: hypothetical protein N6759_005126 [Escherichia coli]|nr:hypothetical protein [Escherichia coli]HCN9415156.1 hypothetical protein [Escherichia coli]
MSDSIIKLARILCVVVGLSFSAMLVAIFISTAWLRIPLYSITDWHRSPISDSHTFDQPGTPCVSIVVASIF